MPRKLFDRAGRGLKAPKSATTNRRFARIPTPTQKRVENTLGIIYTAQMGRNKLFRNEDLDLFDQYYESTQYDGLNPWEQGCDNDGAYVPVRKRKPRVIYNVAKVLADKVAGKLVGSAVFPTFKIEDDPEDTQFFKVVQKASEFRANLVDPIKRCLISGSSFTRFYLVNGSIQMEWANAKYCYPVFDATGELEQIEIKYVFEDSNDQDANGKFKKKWYKLFLSTSVDILFDNPEFREGAEPKFEEVERNEHNFGWVQGQWFRTGKDKFSPDGPSLIGEILDFIDDLNYSLSQSSQAIGYNQDPQLTVKGIDEDELEKLIRSSQKAWNLGRKDAEAAFVESTMKGVEVAEENRKSSRDRMLEVVRVVLHDPEKIVGNASSGKALEVLHGPLVELIDELRTVFEPMLKSLLIKMGMTILAMETQGYDTVVEFPPGYRPSSIDLSVIWPAIFPATIEDIQKISAAAVQVTSAKILSRESALKWVASYFGVENVEEELARIAAEPELNPFGAF